MNIHLLVPNLFYIIFGIFLLLTENFIETDFYLFLLIILFSITSITYALYSLLKLFKNKDKTIN